MRHGSRPTSNQSAGGEAILELTVGEPPGSAAYFGAAGGAPGAPSDSAAPEGVEAEGDPPGSAAYLGQAGAAPGGAELSKVEAVGEPVGSRAYFGEASLPAGSTGPEQTAAVDDAPGSAAYLGEAIAAAQEPPARVNTVAPRSGAASDGRPRTSP
jgi:hypothetical protein